MAIDELKAAALRLDPGERAELASGLLVSLDDLSEYEIEKRWIEEAMRRDAALDNGTARAIPADDKNLVRDHDGSTTLLVANTPPGEHRQADWLPAPDDPFPLYTRAYWPGEAILDGSWTPSAVVKVA